MAKSTIAYHFLHILRLPKKSEWQLVARDLHFKLKLTYIICTINNIFETIAQDPLHNKNYKI